MGNDPDQQSGPAANASDVANNKEPVGSAIPSNPEGWHPQEQEHRRHERRYWKASVFLTLIAMIGAVASAWFAWRAVQASQNTAISARDAVTEAKRQASAAEQQTAIAKDAEIRQLRAYLHVWHSGWHQYAPQIPGSGPQFGTEVRFGHTGTTPAYNVRLDATIEIGRYLVGDLNLGNPIMMGGGTVTKKSYSILYGSNPVEVLVATPFEANALRSTTTDDPLIGDNRFYMHGIIRYLDIFGLEDPKLERRYEFCWIFHPEREPDGSERGCEKYNKPG